MKSRRAYAPCDAKLETVDEIGRRSDCCQQFGDPVLCKGGVQSRKDNQEFLAAVSSGQIIGAQSRAEAIGRLANDFVAGQMPVTVIDPLEMPL
jgi:hypothetical protein